MDFQSRETLGFRNLEHRRRLGLCKRLPDEHQTNAVLGRYVQSKRHVFQAGRILRSIPCTSGRQYQHKAQLSASMEAARTGDSHASEKFCIKGNSMKTDTFDFFERQLKNCQINYSRAIIHNDMTAAANIQRKIAYYQEALDAITEVDILRLELATIKNQKRS